MSFGGKARREEARRSQKRENLSTLKRQKASHVESADWEAKAQRDFDKWFFSLSKTSQDAMRKQGVIPYREMPDPRRKLAPLFERSSKFVTQDNNNHEEQSQFISRERVVDVVKAILRSMSTSSSPEVRLHFELVRMALRMDDAMRGEDLGRLYNLGRAGINYRVQQMREIIGTSLADLLNPEKTQKNTGFHAETVEKRPKRNLFEGGGVKRVVPHCDKKSQFIKSRSTR
jgi:hypothetical protein